MLKVFPRAEATFRIFRNLSCEVQISVFLFSHLKTITKLFLTLSKLLFL